MLVEATAAGCRGPVGVVVFRVVLLIPMIGGFGAIQALNAPAATDGAEAKVDAF